MAGDLPSFNNDLTTLLIQPVPSHVRQSAVGENLLSPTAIQCRNMLCRKTYSVMHEILLFLPYVSLHEIQWEKSCSLLAPQFTTATCA